MIEEIYTSLLAKVFTVVILFNVKFSQKIDYYHVLEVQPNAEAKEIVLAYEKCKQTFSLGNIDLYSVFSPSEARAWIHLIEEAYKVLSSRSLRQQYDDFRREQPMNIQAPNLNVHIQEENCFAPAKPNPALKSAAHHGYGSSHLGGQRGYTSISQYELSEEIENEIENRMDFDGLFLKKIRVYKNVSIADFSRKTCIGSRHINAIENNNFSALPAAVFVRGYIVQYCRVLGLKEDIVVGSFMNHFRNEQRSLS